MTTPPFSPALLASPTGAALSIRHWPAEGVARGILLISHGLAEHSGRYAAFAGAMSAKGFSVHALDHRGHGATRAPDAPLGSFGRGGAAAVFDDLEALRAHACAAEPGLPVLLFGHSMGGLIALNAAARAETPYDGLAVWNSNFFPGIAGRLAQGVLAMERMRLGSDVPSVLLPRLTFEAWGKAVPGARTPFDWLSHDEAVVAAYLADPLCGFPATVGLWQALFQLAFAGVSRESVARLPHSLPIHLAGGGEDPATDHGVAVRRLADRLRRAGLSDVTLRIDPRARHETLNDHGREAAIEDFAAWALRLVEASRR
ncbi:alpha/beta fold hydrolase [Rhizobium sp. YIM 134829]|uniref:alpha/beta fold hydrolase n=1 Tax=Rhizobium sp. YIM 134829 TaxID=3390453 RepID=UPI00397ADE29